MRSLTWDALGCDAPELAGAQEELTRHCVARVDDWQEWTGEQDWKSSRTDREGFCLNNEWGLCEHVVGPASLAFLRRSVVASMGVAAQRMGRKHDQVSDHTPS